MAVLPFSTVVGLGGAEQDYLAEGLSQELINQLSRVAGIRVASRISPLAFWAKPVPVRDIARQLNVGMTNGEANQAATDAFTRSVALDSSYAEALVARARAQTYMACNGGVSVSRAGALLDAALADAQRAVAQSPRLGAAHAVLGLVLGCRLQDLGRVAAEYGQAVALAPYDAATVTSYALFQTDLGHMDLAVKEVTYATELDPLASVYDRMLAQILAYAGRFPEAFVALRHAAGLPPADPNADRIFRGIVLTVQNDMPRAREVCAGGVDYFDLVCLALADHALGREAEAGWSGSG